PLHANGSSSPPPAEVTVTVAANVAPASANLKIEAPSGWRVEPVSQPVDFARAGESRDYHFKLRPPDGREGYYPIRAVLDYKGKQFSEGYSVVSRPDLDNTAYYYQPATQRVSLVHVNVPSALKVGYVMGAGDEIPTILGQLGIDLHLISPEELASGDFTRYDTVILGIRAYDTRDDLRAKNQRLLDYVKNGGTLMVQYNTGVADFNVGKFTPFPAELSRDRVTVEEAPVEMLPPNDPIFHFPNQITARDFEGWVQERGLYFMDKWDPQFQALLSSHDPGEPPREGGLLLAHYGKGIYIYNAYAFFRQLPSGVPGAVRLYVNLISAGLKQK
ncbi:MAG TPA: NEW3 domain-containing protein, partial [Terriglobales bacterium]|nr:NEW3 domain-containing protein [Terriglobales bacterium]